MAEGKDAVKTSSADRLILYGGDSVGGESYSGGMIIVSGWISVDPGARDDYLRGCVSVVEQARASVGCLDFAIGADLVETDRINVYERWESEESLDAFRGSGPSDDQTAMIRDAEVVHYTAVHR